MSYNPIGGYGHQHEDEDQYHNPHNPFMEQRPSPLPHSTTPQQGYQLDDRPYHEEQYNDHIYNNSHANLPMQHDERVDPYHGSHIDMPNYPGDRLAPQPTYAVENIPNSYGHNEEYEQVHVQHEPNAAPYYEGAYSQDHAYTPTPTPGEHHQYFHDEADTRPILQPDNAYGPDPHQVQPDSRLAPQDPTHPDIEAAYQAPPPATNIRRWKTVKQIDLYRGNLVLDCPIPPRLLNQVQHATPPDRDEYTHMRYTACTCDPSEFYDQHFTLRQQLFAKPRKTELFIVVTMYNEEDELLARTLIGVIKNIEYMNSRNSSKTWGKEAWKKIVLCIVSDGRAKINPRTRSVLAAMGVYQDGIAKQSVNGKDVTAHIYEYTTQMKVEIKKGIVNVVKGSTPVQVLFCLKEKNQKKINSHRWFFQAFGEVLQPNICVLIDAGTRPGRDSIYQLWKAFDREPQCAGACGEIKAMLEGGKNLINPLIAAQNFEYKMSNILDKPLESAFGFISVLPGAFSAYRFVALQNDKQGHGPLEKYFAGEKMHGGNAGIFTANMYLAEDRILCYELVSKRNCQWILQYVKSATGETDVPSEMSDFILQRRRWLNGSFFAAVYALVHAFSIFRSSHSAIRKTMFLVEFTYQLFSMLFAWFALGNFFLVFKILTASLSAPDLLGTAGTVLGAIFEWAYLAILLTCFVLALGNRPQGSGKLYMSQVIFWAAIMIYLLFASIFITVKSVQSQLAKGNFTISMLFTNNIFFTLIISMCSTWLLYFVASILFFDPWHMITSFIQYLLLTPTYINILNVYAFANVHDITWGTKGSDTAEKLGSATVKADGKVDVSIPSDEHDLNSQYEAELRSFNSKWVPPKRVVSEEQKHEDYYKGFRSAVLLSWIFSNLALSAIVLDIGGTEGLSTTADVSTQQQDRANIYMAVVLYSVAALSAVRFIGCVWFLVVRLFRGV